MYQDMVVEKTNHSLGDDLFFIAYMLLFLSEMFSTYTNLSDIFGNSTIWIVRTLYFAFLGTCVLKLILRRNYLRRELLTVGALLLVGAITYFISDSHVFLDTVLVICIAKDVNFEKFIKRALILQGIFIFSIIALSGIGVISTVVKERNNVQMRTSLGFNHPNTLGLLVFQFIAGVVIIQKDNLRIIQGCLLFLLGLITYLITRSQTSMICIILLLFTVFVYLEVERTTLTKKQIRRMAEAILIVGVVVLAVVIRYYWANPGELAFSTLATRIRLAQKYLNAYGVNLFGHYILIGANVALPGYSAGYSYLDNAEVWYLVRYGIIGFVIFFYIYLRMVKQTLDQQDIISCIVASVYLIYSLAENSTCRVTFNFMIVYAGISFYESALSNHRKKLANKKEVYGQD